MAILEFIKLINGTAIWNTAREVNVTDLEDNER